MGLHARWLYPAPPTLVRTRAGHVWQWEAFRVRKVAGRGVSVFAKVDLPAGTLLPYGGAPVTAEQIETRGRLVQDRYVLEMKRALGFSGVDANPALLRSLGGHAQAWLGSLANEAAPGQLYNARYFQFQEDDTSDMPAYPDAPPPALRCFVELMAPVRAGDEVLVAYGFKANRREYSVAPPPPRSMPPEWRAHLAPREAAACRAAREEAAAEDAKAAKARTRAQRLEVITAARVAATRTANVKSGFKAWRDRRAAHRARAAHARACRGGGRTEAAT